MDRRPNDLLIDDFCFAIPCSPLATDSYYAASLLVTDLDGSKVHEGSIFSFSQKMLDAEKVEGHIPPLMDNSPLMEIIRHGFSMVPEYLYSDKSAQRYSDEHIHEDIKKFHDPSLMGNIIGWAHPRIVPVSKYYRGEGKPVNPSSYGEEHGSEPEMFVLATSQSTMHGNGGPVVFYLDSGASHHASGDERILSNLRDLLAGRTVTLADGFRLDVTKVGDFQTPEIQIQDVHLVPGLKMNLISVRQLAKSKVVTTFHENYAELFLGGERIGGALVDDMSLYRLSYLEALPRPGELA